MVMWLYTGQYSRQSEDSDASGVMTLEILKGLAGDRAMRKCCTDLAVPVAESTAYQDGPLAFHAKVYAVAKEYCILGLQTASSRNFSRFLNKRSPDDLCAAALVIHSSVPSDDTELRVQCVNKTARTFEELVQAENYTLVLSLAPDFVNDIAVEMRRQVKTLSEQNGRQELLLIVRCEACSKFDLP